ncbi:NmrA family NAD(P)-binding protein [Nonomuraea sp. K274]|uniref:NmrA family NAD(P)-binding protein n=1 Tax=Nonomuraea cypriaca TaxID=1187855 RepID=A0A931F4P9_9ACTN|nr:NmrA family NAD(P)-binding protein [Nonomuraea cypriaca]MBF8191183.1 NmrA family NAD(P)-binding protein [Nonomuraea cypriaca]
MTERNEQKKILVTGATGNVGRNVVSLLTEAGHTPRVLVRDPRSARLPAGVEVAVGDLTEPGSLDAALEGVESVFLLWPFVTAEGAEPVVEAIAKHSRQVVYLSAFSVRDDAEPAENGVWGQVERLIERSGVRWTFLRAGGFAANTLGWAGQIRDTGVVRAPYAGAARSLIHEADIAAVAASALTEDGHDGRRYLLTGPEVLTQAEQVRLIGAAIGRELRFDEQPREEAREQMVAAWGAPEFVDQALDHWARIVDEPEPVVPTVREVTGRPARTFLEWARDHAADFRNVRDVADAYAGAFLRGSLEEAMALLAEDIVRVAPLEGGGELHGPRAIVENAGRLTADYDIHGVDVEGPFVAGDRFAIKFTFDELHRPTGQRTNTTKMSLYTVSGGRIVREEVYYFDRPQAVLR